MQAFVLHDRNPPGSRGAKGHQDFLKVFERMPIGAYRVTSRGKILAVNAALVRMLGFSSSKQLRSFNIEKLRSMPQQTWPEFRKRLSGDGQIKGIESIWARKDRSSMIAKENVWTVPAVGGSSLYFEGTVFDITGRKADEALRIYRTVFESLPVGLAQKSLEGEFLQTNQALQAMLGYSEAELEHLKYPEILHSNDLEQELARFQEVIRGERAFHKSEKRYRHKNGSYVWVQETVSLVRDGTGNPKFVNAVVEDVTQRKQAERRLLQRTKELEAANVELEAFAYTVSHDLRTPLRAIDSFSTILAQEQGSRLDAEAQDHLRRIRSATGRMAQFIDDLLEFSKMTRAEIHREQVNLSDLARAVVEPLRQRDPKRNVKLEIQDGLEIQGDSHLLRVVLENLFGNAWKFTGKKKTARIRFGMKTHFNKPVFFIEDNGAGFNMAYASKLFHPFQRLHAATEFEGTGIGLATIHRIIERHGGRIWAEGRVNVGATFYFTL